MVGLNEKYVEYRYYKHTFYTAVQLNTTAEHHPAAATVEQLQKERQMEVCCCSNLLLFIVGFVFGFLFVWKKGRF